MRRASLLGVRIDLPSRRELLALLRERLRGPSPGLLTVTTVNAECLAIAHADPSYKAALARSDLNLVDGVGVALALRLKGRGPAERLPGRELVGWLAALCQEAGASLFLLGASPSVAGGAARRLGHRYPGLVVAWHSPPRLAGPHMPAPVEREVLAALRRHRPGALCVALGMPKQELWIDAHRRRLASLGVRVAVGVGGALDYLAGAVPAPPPWASRWGLEWLFRLLAEPRRRLGRQGRRLPLFAGLALAEAIRARLTSLDRRPSFC